MSMSNTVGFNHINTYMQANSQNATFTSDCISLLQPSNGEFIKWSFMDIRVFDVADVTSNSLIVQTCDGNTDLKTFIDLAQGINSLDLRDVDPTASSIRIQWQVNHSGVPGGGITPAKLDWWKIVGVSKNIVEVHVNSTVDQVRQTFSATHELGFSSDGGVAEDVDLIVSMDDVNGWHTPGVDDGLSEDSEVDYGFNLGLRNYSGISASTVSSIPGATFSRNTSNSNRQGYLIWELPQLEDGLSVSTTFNLVPANHYINGKVFGVAPYIQFGHQPVTSLGFDGSIRLEDRDSTEVFVNANTAFYNFTHQVLKDNEVLTLSGQTPIFAENETGYAARFEIRTQPEFNTTGIEYTTVTITLNGGTCIPIYQGLRRTNGSLVNSDFFIQQPLAGSLATDPIIVVLPRLGSVAQNYETWFDTTSCNTGDTIQYTVNARHRHKEIYILR